MDSEKEENTMIKKSRGSGSCCSVSSCKNTGKTKMSIRPDIKFHRFPKNPDLRREWMRKCGRKERFNPDTGTVCSDHFAPEDYQRDLRAELLGLGDDKKKLAADAVPCRNLPPEIQRRIRKRRDRELTEGEKLARRKKLVEEAIEWAESLPAESPESVIENKPKKILESTVVVSRGSKVNLSPNSSEILSQARKNFQIDSSTIRVLQLPEKTPVEVTESESDLSKQTQTIEISGTEASLEDAMTIEFVDASAISSSPITVQEENSTWNDDTYRKKYLELMSDYEEINTKYKRCYKVLCCFKIAYTKLRSQNSTAKSKIIELRQKNRFLLRQVKQRNEKKTQKQNKFVQTYSDPFEDDVSGWW